MRNIKLTIAYDGSGYHGWQRQADGIETIQQVLENALAHVVNHPVNLRASGRTDTGVHADGQVANFSTTTPIPSERLPHALNTRLPGDIRIRRAQDVPADFDATGSVRTKLYRYSVYNHADLPPALKAYCWHYWRHCQITPMQQAAAGLVGEHDFLSFASAGFQSESTVRTLLRCDVWGDYPWIYFDLEGTGFLYHMVRNIVGTLLEIGRGHWPPEAIETIINARNRNAAGPMAPPNGLKLMWVKY
ncbi:MAG: tRNA pseudouridine(38-40) synthase TruA [Sedimentisphaerales bacterium]|nr:tRNA pseudouridine(38-40) synthase TruA [Sedimentisphaerales bacterium]